MTRYRNTEEAFLDLLRTILDDGDDITVRDKRTLEIRSQLIEIQNPRERALVIPGRNNNVFASIAESMWVLAGRDDIGYLDGYLKRAHDFSDDGITWRGAYGPRLRNWNGTDQIREIIALLTDDPASRRAVATLYDPDRDFVDSKDIPCNNWLHFLRREGRLHLQIAARSTDIWFGFSGINIFEWALLLEMVAHWLGDTIGQLSFFTTSLHLYERHFDKARTLLDNAAPRSPTYQSNPYLPTFTTPWDQFDDVISEWMILEAQLRDGADLELLRIPFADPLLEQYIRMIDIFWAFRRGAPLTVLEAKTTALRGSDLAHAATEFLNRPNSREH